MPCCRFTLLALLAAQLLGKADALRAPLRTARNGRGTQLSRRATFSSTTGNTTVADFSNTEYLSEITVGGTQFTVSLDTGSSDLNIFGNPAGAKDSNPPIQIQVGFAEGEDDGVLSFADVEFAGYTVPSQIFNHAPPGNGSTPDDGLLGLGPTEGSVLSQTAQAKLTLPKSASDSLLDRIFQQNTSTSNFMTFTLGRELDPNSNNPTGGQGDFTIGEIIPTLSNISNMPQLPVLTNTGDSQLQHWTVTLDSATGANGQPITFAPSIVKGTPSGKLVVVFDSGFTLPQVTPEIAKAIYGGISGSQLQNINGLGTIYTLPCDAAINASFTFSGQTYPIHPLDLSLDAGDLFGNGGDVCVGAFQPIQEDATSALAGGADMILGDGFLMNVYILLNFGDFVDSTGDAKKTPYVQLLSTTNPVTATAQFISVRGGTGASGSSGGSSSSSATTSTVVATVKRFLPAIIIGVVGLLIVSIVLCYCCCCRRKRAAPTRYVPVGTPAPAPGGYAPPYGAPPYAPYGQSAPYGQPQDALYQDPFRDTSGPAASYNDIPMQVRGGGPGMRDPNNPYR